MKRHAILFQMMLVLCVMLTGCKTGDTAASQEPSAVEVAEYVGQKASLSDMKQGDWERLQRLYSLDQDIAEDFALFTASSNVKADELAIIKVKDMADVDDVLARLEQRIAAQTTKFQNYRPEEYYLIEKHVLKSKGSFILFVVSEEAALIEESFDEALK